MKKLINKYNTFIKYIISSGICLLIDLSIFTILNYILKSKIGLSSILVATVSARIISSCINYYLNRNKVFNKDNKKFDTHTFISYAILVIIQMFASSFFVTYFFKLTKFNTTIIKFLVDLVLFVVNFFVQRFIIFKKEDKPKSNIILFIYACLSSISFLVYPLITDKSIMISIRGQVLVLTILTIGIYIVYKKYYNNLKYYKPFKVLSIIFTLLLIFGYSFYLSDTSDLVYSNYQYAILSVGKLFGYYISINFILNFVYEYISTHELKEYTSKKFKRFTDYFNKHPFKFTFIFLLIVYSIYFLAFYPGVVGYDPSYQICEVMGIPTFYTTETNFTNNLLITQFNPVIHTLLVGGLFKIGHLIGYDNFGIALYTLIQVLSMVSILSYTVKFMYEEKVNSKLLYACLIIYAFVPVFGFYSISAFKDTYYAIFFILFILELFKMIKYKANKKDTILFIISAIGVCAFRHNGYITVLLTSLIMLVSLKLNRKQILLSIIAVTLVHLGFKGVINYYQIAPTSIREVLSIPIQQTAALIVNNENIIESEDRYVIGRIIDYDSVKENYNPELSDPVKNTFNKDATKEELIAYFKVWFKYLLIKPKTYIEATVNNIYGYFYPDAQRWYIYHKKYKVLNEVGLDYHYVGPGIIRKTLVGYAYAYQHIPVLNLTVSIGFTTWIYLYILAILIKNKHKKYIILLLPAFLTILMCVVGPINLYYRYVIPYSMSLPMILFLLYNEKVLKENRS